MITSSFNAGVDASLISLTAKHRRLEQLKRYATPDDESALALGKVVSAFIESGYQIEEEQNLKMNKKQRFN